MLCSPRTVIATRLFFVRLVRSSWFFNCLASMTLFNTIVLHVISTLDFLSLCHSVSFALENIFRFLAISSQHVPNILLCILAASCPRGQLDKWRHQYWRIADTGRREGVYLSYIIVGQVEWKKRNDSTVDNDICLSDFYAMRWEIIYEVLFGSMNNVYVNNGTWISYPAYVSSYNYIKIDMQENYTSKINEFVRRLMRKSRYHQVEIRSAFKKVLLRIELLLLLGP